MKTHLSVRALVRRKPLSIALISSLWVMAVNSNAYALKFHINHDATDITVGDMNSDGLDDVVTCGTADGRSTVNVLLASGDGTFQRAKATAVRSGPVAIVLGDYNLDGRLDVVTANAGGVGTPGKSISVLLGNGDGTFQPPLRLNLQATPNSIATADLNGDGALDLAVGASSGFVVLLGDGTGAFQVTSSIRTSDFSTGIAVGDTDGDGTIDVLMGNSQTAPTLSRGNGDGTFQRAAATSANPVIKPVLVDMTGDSLPDLGGIVASAPNNFQTFVNVGDAVFAFKSDIGAFSTLDDFAPGDFNHDGKVDFVLAQQTFGTEPDFPLPVFGQGDGSFEVGQAGVGLDLGDVIAVGFFNADGEPDLAGGDSTDPVVRTLYGLGDGIFDWRP